MSLRQPIYFKTSGFESDIDIVFLQDSDVVTTLIHNSDIAKIYFIQRLPVVYIVIHALYMTLCEFAIRYNLSVCHEATVKLLLFHHSVTHNSTNQIT